MDVGIVDRSSVEVVGIVVGDSVRKPLMERRKNNHQRKSERRRGKNVDELHWGCSLQTACQCRNFLTRQVGPDDGSDVGVLERERERREVKLDSLMFATKNSHRSSCSCRQVRQSE